MRRVVVLLAALYAADIVTFFILVRIFANSKLATARQL